jgi:hypothetical protein
MSLQIDRAFLRPDRFEYLRAIASVLPAANRRRRAVYLLAGSDFVTAYLLSGGAERTIMIDRLPFHGMASGGIDLAGHRNEYYFKKHELNFAVEPDLLPEVGCLQYLLWELEAMGIGDADAVRATLTEDRSARSYTLRYRLPDAPEKTLIYYEIEDARTLKNYPKPLLAEMSDGIDCLIRKAAVNVKIANEVLGLLVAGMDEQGLMFVDDQSRAMLDDTGAQFCPMSETAMRAIREVEASRSILFGYNPVSVYQSTPARRRWEVDRRYRRERIPALVIVLDPGPLDPKAIAPLLEGTDVKLVVAGGAEGAVELAQRYPGRVAVELTCSPESLKQRYLSDSTVSASILGSEDASRHFTDCAGARYFVTSSVDYPYSNCRIEDLIALSICDEEALPEYEHIFHPSLGSNRYWLRYDLFRHMNPHAVEAELAGYAREIAVKPREEPRAN